MPRSLPARASLRYLHEQAKDLLKAHKQRNSQVCATLRHLHRFAQASDADILAAPIALHEAQYALALDHGFASWNDLPQPGCHAPAPLQEHADRPLKRIHFLPGVLDRRVLGWHGAT